jgi:LCP family protein required for cell wall assembly
MDSAANIGNGRVNGPRSKWLRVLARTGLVLLVLGAGIAGTAAVVLHRVNAAVRQTPLLGGAAASAPAAGNGFPLPVTIPGPLNILLIGTDDRPGDVVDGSRSDTIIIVHIPASHDRAYLVSIPRDSRVDIPAYPRTGYQGGVDKINAAYAYGFLNGGGRAGGTELLALTVKQLTGLTFNAAAIVNFAGFQSVVDTVGGIDMCVDEKTVSVHIGWDSSGKETPPYELVPPDYRPARIPGVRPQVYLPGCQHLAGWQALDYVRQRELIPDGDYGRQRHQQQFLKALLEKATSAGVLTNPVRLNAILGQLGGALTFDGNGFSATDWLFTVRDISSERITMVRTNGGDYNTEVIGGQDFEILTPDSLRLFQSILDDDVGGFLATHPSWVSTDTAATASPSATPSR